MAEELAGIFTLDGIATNSIGLDVNGLILLLSSFELFWGPLMTAECLEKVKSISRSYAPLFLKGIRNFWQACPFFTTRGMTFSPLHSVMTSSF